MADDEKEIVPTVVILSGIELIDNQSFQDKEWIDLDLESCTLPNGDVNNRYGRTEVWGDGIMVTAESLPVQIVNESAVVVEQVEPQTCSNVLRNYKINRVRSFYYPIESPKYPLCNYVSYLVNR